MRSTRRLNKTPLPRGAGSRGQGYEHNKKAEDGDGDGGRARGVVSKEEKARNQSKISVVPLQRAGKQTEQRSVHKAAVSVVKKMKVNLRINNPFPA